MLKINKLKSSGNIILFVIIGVVVIAVIGVVVFNVIKNSSSGLKSTGTNQLTTGEMPEPVYEVIIGDIKLTMVAAEDLGNILKCEERINPAMSESRCLPVYDFNTTEKLIKVTITAQNVGTDNTARGKWKMEEMFDAVGRKFYSVSTKSKAGPWISKESDCGASLKPNFEPTICTQIYEVSRYSTGLKVEVSSRGSGGSEYFLDLGLYDEKYCWDESDCDYGLNKYTRECFVGNKVYLEYSTSSTSTIAKIEECKNYYTATEENPRVLKCVEHECELVLPEELFPPEEEEVLLKEED